MQFEHKEFMTLDEEPVIWTYIFIDFSQSLAHRFWKDIYVLELIAIIKLRICTNISHRTNSSQQVITCYIPSKKKTKKNFKKINKKHTLT